MYINKHFLKLFLVAIIFFINIDLKAYSNQNAKQQKEINYIIKKVLETDKKNYSYEARISLYSKGFYNKGKKLTQLRETRMSGFMKFKRPINVLFKVEESEDRMALGSTLLYTGGDKVYVRASGLLGLIKVSFDINDPIFSNARNHKFSFDGLRNLRNTNINAQLLGKGIKNGEEVYILKVLPLVKADYEITHEIYYVDTNNFRVLGIDMFVNKDLVSQYNVKDIKINSVKNSFDSFDL